MKRVRFLPRAQADLESIADYIARESPQAARGLIQDLRARCALLRSHPEQGRAVAAIGAGVRILSYRSYLILYRVEADIEIDRVIHGARDLQTALDGEP